MRPPTLPILRLILLFAGLSLSSTVAAQNPDQQVNLFAIPTMSTSFIRMPARDASQDIDAVYYNPAGLTSLRDGFNLNVNNQFQITTFNMMAYYNDLNESPADYSYYPTNYAFPTIFGSYNRNRFAFFFGIYPAIGGGGATGIANLPSAEFPVADATVTSRNLIGLIEDAYGIDPSETSTDFVYHYDFDSKGLAFSPGLQVGFAFEINQYLSLAVSGRAIYYIVDQEGGLSNLTFDDATNGISLRPGDYFNYVAQKEEAYSDPMTIGLPAPLPDIELPVTGAEILTGIGNLFGELLGDQQVDVIQSSFGITPIVGLNFNWHDRWYIGLKYEHRTYINLVTKVNGGLDGMGLYTEGKEVRADLPGFFTSGVKFQPNEKLMLTAGNRLFFNKRANLNGREQYIKSLYKEFAFGIEYAIRPRFRLSGGAAYRTVRYEDEYYTDVDYFLPAFTFAGGFIADVSRRISVEAGVLSSIYQGRTYYKDYDLFGGQLALAGIELPEELQQVLRKKVRYDVDGKAFVISVGVNFWMGSIDQNREDREDRVNDAKERRKERRNSGDGDISQ